MISSRSDIQTAIISCVLSFLPDSPSVPRTHEWKGSEDMITAYVHHISSVHHQLSVWTYIYMKCIHMKNILPLGETDRIWLAPKNTDYGMPKSVTVLGRTFPVSDPWKSTASERPSNAIESLGGRARVQIAATLICG